MIKVNGSKLLKVFFILLLLSVCYFLFGKNTSNAWQGVPSDSNRIAQLTPGESYFNYTFYDSYKGSNSTIKFPTDYKLNGERIIFFRNQFNGTNIQPDGSYYNYCLCTFIPSADTGYPYNQPTYATENFYSLGTKNNDPRIMAFYDNGTGDLESTYFGNTSRYAWAMWFPYYDNSGNFLGYYANGSSGSFSPSNNSHIIKTFYNINNFIRVNDKWTIDTIVDSASPYPDYIQYMDFDFDSPSYFISQFGRGENEGFSFNISNYDISLMPSNLFLKFALYIDTITENNETLYQYKVFLLPIYINNKWVNNVVNVQQIEGGSDTLYGNIYSDYFVYSGMINEIDRNQPIIGFFDIEDMTSPKYFDIRYFDNNNLRYVCTSSYSPNDLYNIIAINQEDSYNNFNKFNMTTPNYTDDELENKKYNNTINSLDNIVDNINNNNLSDYNIDKYEELFNNMGIDVNTGVPEVFNTFKTTFTTGVAQDLTISIPFTNTSFTISSNYFQNYYPSSIVSFVNMVWYGAISWYIVMRIFKIINNIKTINLDNNNMNVSKIYEDLL